MELSPREQKILTQLEDDLAPDDDGLGQALTAEPTDRSRHSPTLWTWLGLSGLLALGLVAVIVVYVLMPGVGTTGFGVLTVGVVVAWVLLALARLRRREVDE